MKNHWTSGSFELSECDRNELGRFLRELDIRLLAALLHGRIKLQGEYAALLLESGFLDPASEAIDYADERARAISNAIWEADYEVFDTLLSELFAIDTEGDIEAELAAIFDAAQGDRAQRVAERDKEAGIDVTESDLMEKVDLDSLNFDEDGDDDDAYDDP